MDKIENLECYECDSFSKCCEYIDLTNSAIRCVHFHELKNIATDIDKQMKYIRAKIEYSPEKVGDALRIIMGRINAINNTHSNE